jgi:PAS domain S-box-containing protein
MSKHQQLIYQATVQSIWEGIIVVDNEQVIQSINPVACGLLEVNADEMIGNHFTDIPCIANLKKFGQTVELRTDARFPDRPYEQWWSIAFPNGHVLEFQTGPVIDSEQQRIGTLIIVEEVTLEHTARTMLYDMFNEMHMPLSIIKGYVDILIQEIDGSLSEEQAKMVNTIKDRVEYTLTLKQDVKEACKKQEQDQANRIIRWVLPDQP